MKAVVVNPKERFVQSILDFDFLCFKEPSTTACVSSSPFRAFYGNREVIIPSYSSVSDVEGEVEVVINLASQRSAAPITLESLERDDVKVVVMVAEGVREQEVKKIIKKAKEKGKTVIGPATVGFLRGGEFKGGLAGGDISNAIKSRLYLKGSVGLVSKSGGMLNEMMRIISRCADGIYEAVAVGGEVFPASTMLDHILRFEKEPGVKMIVALGEIGKGDEYEIIKAKEKGLITKPLIMYVTGSSASLFPWNVQFGHAAAKASSAKESAEEKNRALREAGIIVPESFDRFEDVIRAEARSLGLIPLNCSPLRIPPRDVKELIKEGKARHKSAFVCSIASKGRHVYAGVPASKLFEKGSIGEVIGLLWFKRKLPPFFVEFLEKVVILLADHGPAVSGAHNAIVASRAGKDVISSLCSGLLTIGPRFGGAIDEAMRNWWSYDMDAYEFVEFMKKQGKRIAGIGHRVKSKNNPDERVEMLKAFAKSRFSSTRFLEKALAVERITTQKSEKLILNVDGAVAALLLDAMESSGFSKKEIEEFVELGIGNALFAFSRSLGIIGHAIDQKRLKQPLFREDEDNILYLE